MSSVVASRRIRFGPFELDRQTGELWKHGTKVRLQGKPYQVLIALLERPGETVSREELRQRLWSGDTFVDFESGLNTAANRLRITLGDSAENPRYVETLARTGYRFVARVDEVSDVPVAAAPAPPAPAPPSNDRELRWGMAIAGTIFVIAATWWAARRSVPETPTFQQVTFGRGMVAGARFAPDGQTILYSAKWESEPWRLYLVSSVSPETRALEFQNSTLSAVSKSAELALLSRDGRSANLGSTLSRVPMNGGSPLNVADRVVCADWAPDGRDLSIVRFAGRRTQLEYPPGKILYQTASQLGCPRFSPDGAAIAVVETPGRGNAYIKVSDLKGNVRTLSSGWSVAGGLAWAGSGREVWFSASRTGGPQALWATTLSGKVRLVFQAPGSLRLEDIARDGRVLLTEMDRRVEMVGRAANDSAERDLSWFDFSSPEDFSADGNLILFDEGGQGGGPNYTVYLRRLSDNATVRLAEGHALALSPDGRFAVVLNVKDRRRISVVPVGEGVRRDIAGGIEYHWARFFPDGQRLLVGGNRPGASLGLYLQPVTGGKAQPLAPQTYLRSVVISPDGKSVAGNDPEGNIVVLGVEGGAQRIINAPANSVVVGWTPDLSSLLVRDLSIPVHVNRIELSTGRSTLWREIVPLHEAGIQSLNRLFFARDGQASVYSFNRILAKLYLANGLR